VRVYIAGKMEWINEEDSVWKECLEMFGRREDYGEGPKAVRLGRVEVILPSMVGFDHGGDLVEGIVEADIGAVEGSDAVVAVFTENVQVGTIVELLHALAKGKLCLAIFVHPTARIPEGEDYEEIIDEVDVRCRSDHYWFLINYLLKHPNTWVYTARDRKTALKIAEKWIQRIM
jgi:nucleoside 2-deoxyribosyltransferase